MLVRRIITAANVSALGATAKVQPPSVRFQTLDAAGTARFSLRIDAVHNGISLYAKQFLRLSARLEFAKIRRQKENDGERELPAVKRCERLG
jgi:hypothetical protein